LTRARQDALSKLGWIDRSPRREGKRHEEEALQGKKKNNEKGRRKGAAVRNG